MKRILLLATGGTIVCSDEGQGLTPRFTAGDLIEEIRPNLPDCSVDWKDVMNIDSSNMTPECWLRIAQGIVEESDAYDGFVVTHGTDTMAYTASALTYLLQGLNKPVVLTGSQYPMTDSTTDALLNLEHAVLVACEELAGVFIVFDGQVINGTRGVKTKTRSYDAFESVNYPVVATIKHNRIEYNPTVRETFVKKKLPSEGGLSAPSLALDRQLLVIKMFPGLHPGIFDYVRHHYDGVIIESYGAGGMATDSMDMAGKMRELAEAGLVVTITTQCLREGVDLTLYEVGRKLPFDRIIYGRDMTTEALVPKLMWAMSKADSFKDIKELVETPIQADSAEN